MDHGPQPPHAPSSNERTPGFSNRRQFVSAFTVRLGTLAVLSLVVASLLTFQSHSQRAVFDRWSYEAAAILLILGGAWLGLVAHTVLRSQTLRRRTVAVWTGLSWFRVAVLVWAAGYAVRWLDRPNAFGELLNMELVATASPLALWLEGAALLCLIVGVAVAMAGRNRTRWFNYALPFAAAFAGLVLVEFIARVVIVVRPDTRAFPTVSGDLWERRYVRLNEHGFRSATVALERPVDRRRLLVVGDSYVHGVGVRDPNDRFGEQLADRLRGTWEVVTAGRPDSHTRHHLDFLEQFADYEPEVVVLVYVFNDIEYLTGSPGRTVLTEAPSSLLDRVHPFRLAFKNSVVIQELFVRWRALQYSMLGGPSGLGAYEDTTTLFRHLDDLESFVDRARQRAAIVTIVPFDISVADVPLARRRYRRFVAAARMRGLPVTPIGEAFAGQRSARLQVNPFDPHPNETAHELAAEAAASALRTRAAESL